MQTLPYIFKASFNNLDEKAGVQVIFKESLSNMVGVEPIDVDVKAELSCLC